MTVHTVTIEVKLASKVIVNAPPGERPEKVIDIAISEVEKARKALELVPPFTEVHVGVPQYQEDRRWLVTVSTIQVTGDLVEV